MSTRFTSKVLALLVIATAVLVSPAAPATAASAASPEPAIERITSQPRAFASDTRWRFTNGCTLSPDGVPGFYNFRDICNQHDVCYARFSNGRHQYGTDENGRYTCDALFFNSMTNYCASRFGRFDPRRLNCYSVASNYYTAVRNLGRSFYYDHNTKW